MSEEDINDERIKYATGEYDVEVVRRLSLPEAGLLRIRGLERCRLLVSLSLPMNSIEKIEGLETLMSLRRLDLSCNEIRQVGEGLRPLEELEYLDLSGNAIVGADEAARQLPQKILYLHFRTYDKKWTNPCCEEPTYAVAMRLPSLLVLDGERLVLASERAKLEAMLEALKPDYFEHLPTRNWLEGLQTTTTTSTKFDQRLLNLEGLSNELSNAIDQHIKNHH